MECYNIQQREEIVKIYYQNGSSVRQTFRVLREVYSVLFFTVRFVVIHIALSILLKVLTCTCNDINYVPK